MSRNIKGIFYGVSTGPGDPELMTVKAVRILKEADVIAAARVMGKQETALEIAKQAVCRRSRQGRPFGKRGLWIFHNCDCKGVKKWFILLGQAAARRI